MVQQLVDGAFDDNESITNVSSIFIRTELIIFEIFVTKLLFYLKPSDSVLLFATRRLVPHLRASLTILR